MWKYPFSNVAAVIHTRVYRNTNSSFATAVEIGISGGSNYFDPHDDAGGNIYYYWVTFVSRSGAEHTVGPATATTEAVVDQLQRYLKNKITHSLLDQTLQDTIASRGTLVDAILAEALARVDGDSQLKTLADALQDTLATVDTKILNEINVRRTEDSALVTRINGLVAKSDSNWAAVVRESEVRSDKDSASVAVTLGLKAAVEDNEAAITETANLRISGDAAIASTLDQVEATSGGNTAKIATVNTIQSNMQALHTVKIDANGHVAGFGLYGDNVTSQFKIRSDRFYVGSATSPDEMPFVVDANRVLVNSAIIGQGTMLGTHLIDSAIDTLEIDGNAVTKMTTEYIPYLLYTYTGGAWDTITSLSWVGTGTPTEVVLSGEMLDYHPEKEFSWDWHMLHSIRIIDENNNVVWSPNAGYSLDPWQGSNKGPEARRVELTHTMNSVNSHVHTLYIQVLLTIDFANTDVPNPEDIELNIYNLFFRVMELRK